MDHNIARGGQIDDDITQRGALPQGKENCEADVRQKNHREAEKIDCCLEAKKKLASL
jgi:hypothetical protein